MSSYLFSISFWYHSWSSPLYKHTLETDWHPYFIYVSSHSTRCKEAIIYSQFLRLPRICSDETAFVEKNQKHFFFFSDTVAMHNG